MRASKSPNDILPLVPRIRRALIRHLLLRELATRPRLTLKCERIPKDIHPPPVAVLQLQERKQVPVFGREVEDGLARAGTDDGALDQVAGPDAVFPGDVVDARVGGGDAEVDFDFVGCGWPEGRLMGFGQCLRFEAGKGRGCIGLVEAKGHEEDCGELHAFRLGWSWGGDRSAMSFCNRLRAPGHLEVRLCGSL